MIIGVLKSFELDSNQFNELQDDFIVTLPYRVKDTMKGDFVDFVETINGSITTNVKCVEIISSVCSYENETRFRIKLCNQDQVNTLDDLTNANGVA